MPFAVARRRAQVPDLGNLYISMRLCHNIRARYLQLGEQHAFHERLRLQSLSGLEALLDLFEVDDVPDGLEVLWSSAASLSNATPSCYIGGTRRPGEAGDGRPRCDEIVRGQGERDVARCVEMRRER